MGKNQENGKEKYFKMKTFEIEKVSFFFNSSTWQFQEILLKLNLLTLQPGMEDYFPLPQVSGSVQRGK